MLATIGGLGGQTLDRHKLQFLQEWCDEASRTGEISRIRRVVTEAMDATEWVRCAQKDKDGNPIKGVGYKEVPDHSIRLLGASLAAEILGLKGGAKVNLAVNDNRVSISVDQRMTELAQVIPPEQLLAEIQRVADEFKTAQEAKGK